VTVVIESQVKTIADEILDEFDLGQFSSNDIQQIVRSVISQYDISNIKRPDNTPTGATAYSQYPPKSFVDWK
jgi:hypothetical protein